MFEIIGREQELAFLHAFIGRAAGGPTALVLEGEAGIGKSTLWLAGVEHARAHGLRVLSSRPAEAERGLAHVGLGDLFEDVLDEVLPALSPPRRRALEVALLLEEETADAVDARALGIAARGALQELARERPVLVAIDDLQWFDAASAFAVAFALRRLGGSRPATALSAAGREDAAVAPRAGARCRKVPAAARGPTQCRRAAPVPARPTRHAFCASDVAPHPRQVGRKSVFRARAGPRSRSGHRRFRPFPFRRRSRNSCARGSPDCQRPRARRSRWRRPGAPRSPSSRGRTLRRGRSTPAFLAHVIERENGAIRFTHPLFSSVIYQDLGEERRSVHGVCRDRR